jgi:ribosomal protein S17E
LNKVRKLAEDLLAKYPTLFSTNFDANKKALETVAIIRNRALRNQIAGAITSMAAELTPPKPESGMDLEEVISSINSPAAEENPPEEVSQQAV